MWAVSLALLHSGNGRSVRMVICTIVGDASNLGKNWMWTFEIGHYTYQMTLVTHVILFFDHIADIPS